MIQINYAEYSCPNCPNKLHYQSHLIISNSDWYMCFNCNLSFYIYSKTGELWDFETWENRFK